ncbi:MAG: hypothetical protein CBARDMAM_1100 [uncultured Caballeronia sp.]|nr:MAG: hypothetical protein CBARDMAM_1100 [uncultured Caballeronia sp.]
MLRSDVFRNSVSHLKGYDPIFSGNWWSSRRRSEGQLETRGNHLDRACPVDLKLYV